MGRVVILDTVCFKNFAKIALSCTVKETEAIWCFALFVTNLKIDNEPHFWEPHFFFLENWVSYSAAVTLWVKNFIEIALCSTVFEIQAFLCFAFLKNIRNLKMAAIFGEGNICCIIAQIGIV